MAKKKTLGITPKPKTLEEVNQVYANLAAQVGHKTMLASNTQKQIGEMETAIGKTQVEIEEHVKEMTGLAQQGQALRSAQVAAESHKAAT